VRTPGRPTVLRASTRFRGGGSHAVALVCLGWAGVRSW